MTDPFNEPTRDRWGRPLIIPPDNGKPVAYTRVSTLAKTLDEPNALIQWKARMAALGMARSPHLVLETQGLDAIHDDPVSEARRNMNHIADRAAEAAGSTAAASTGTALHAFTQAMDEGRKMKPPPEWAGHLEAYRRATALIPSVAIEQFAVTDEVQAAGTMDRLVRLPDGRVVVADLKTGAHDPQYPLAVCTQLAIYSRGKLYDPDTGARTPLHPDLDTSTGVLIHLPAKQSPGVCTLYTLDLNIGWYAATIAAQVRIIRKAKPISILNLENAA